MIVLCYDYVIVAEAVRGLGVRGHERRHRRQHHESVHDAHLLHELHELCVHELLLAAERGLRLQHAVRLRDGRYGHEHELYVVGRHGLRREHERRGLLHGLHQPHVQQRAAREHGRRSRADGRRWLADPRGHPPRTHREVLPSQLHARQAALFLHLTHHHGHPELTHQDAHLVGDLPVHNGPVPVLPPEPAEVAELDPALSVLQRLLRQGTSDTGQAR